MSIVLNARIVSGPVRRIEDLPEDERRLVLGERLWPEVDDDQSALQHEIAPAGRPEGPAQANAAHRAEGGFAPAPVTHSFIVAGVLCTISRDAPLPKPPETPPDPGRALTRTPPPGFR